MLTNRFLPAYALLLMPGLLLADGKTGDGERLSVRMIGDGRGQQLMAVEATQVPLERVIGEIAARKGTRIHYSVLPREPITATCVGDTARELMRCLLGSDADLVFSGPRRGSGTDSREQPAELWVLGSSFADTRGGASAADSGRCAELPVRHAAKPRTTTAITHVDAIASLPEEPGKLLEMASGADDPAQRANAIARLSADGRVDEDTLRNTLGNALVDADASVRAQAVYGLARHGGAGAASVLQEALGDSDASVRLMAVDSAGVDSQGLALLRQALADSDETVSALAALKLEASLSSGMSE